MSEQHAEMSRKEKFDACISLANFGTQNFHGRRQFEWRIILAFWTLIVAAIVFLNQKPPNGFEHGLLPWICGIMPIIFTIIWVRPIWVANQNDKLIAIRYLQDSVDILRHGNHRISDIPPKIKGTKKYFGFLKDWASWFQILTTAFLSWLLYNATL